MLLDKVSTRKINKKYYFLKLMDGRKPWVEKIFAFSHFTGENNKLRVKSDFCYAAEATSRIGENKWGKDECKIVSAKHILFYVFSFATTS